MTILAGSRLGPSEILSPIGAGGMGEVWRARDPRLGREVAIKVLPASFSAHADRLRRFEQEARTAGILNHPNITGRSRRRRARGRALRRSGAARGGDAAAGARRRAALSAEGDRLRDPDRPRPRALGLTCQLLGRHEEAVASIQKAVELRVRRQTYYLALLAGSYAAAGRRSEALDLLRDLESRSKTQYTAPDHLAFAHMPLGNTIEALGWWFGDRAAFDRLRSDPRFPALLRKIVPA
jgi:tetratricopeptide (TPR) repeat protein